jgi:PD-(D/E)XK nuclease superfamily protein
MLTDPFGTNELTKRIIGCAIRVQDWLGPGVFENVYSECMLHRKQPLTYLKLTALPVGLLLNFNVETLTNGGVKRIINPNYRKSNLRSLR